MVAANQKTNSAELFNYGKRSYSKRFLIAFFATFIFLSSFGVIFANAISTSAQEKKYPELLGEFFSDEHRLVDSDTHRYVVREMRNTLDDSKIHVVLAVIEKMADYPDLDQDIELFTKEVAKYWEIGERRSKQGILVLFSIEDRKFHIAKTGDMSTKLTDEIKAKMLELPVQALKRNDVSLAMKRAANVLVEVVPAFDAENGVKNIMGSEIARTQQNRNRTNQGVAANRSSSNRATGRSTNRNSNIPQERNRKQNSGGSVLSALICVAVAAFMIFGSLAGVGLAAARGFGVGRYGGYHGGGGGGFLSGMITGGLLGSIFGGSNHGWGSGYHHEEHHHHYGGGGDDGGGGFFGGGGGGFDGGFDYDADTFGGGDFDGGSTGEW